MKYPEYLCEVRQFLVIICSLQSGWLSKQFRDCNGESNGIALPEDVQQEEKFCDGNKTELVENSLVRVRMFSVGSH